MKKTTWTFIVIAAVIGLVAGLWLHSLESRARAQDKTQTTQATIVAPATCDGLPDHDKLRTELVKIISEGQAKNTGMGNHEWATVVNRDGVVCAVVFSGPNRGAQWAGSRLISAEKAFTTTMLSTGDFALSTANLYFASQPGQSLYSLVTSAPPNPQAVFNGSPADYGQKNDPFVGKPIGGIITFGGGLPLYDAAAKLVGGLGLSGDTSCADHVIAWKLRHALALDAVPGGIAPEGTDNMIQDMQGPESPSGFGHPHCKGGRPSSEIIARLATDYPTSRKKK